jgi:hypothetical protein
MVVYREYTQYTTHPCERSLAGSLITYGTHVDVHFKVLHLGESELPLMLAYVELRHLSDYSKSHPEKSYR